jgi:hypothetical protein
MITPTSQMFSSAVCLAVLTMPVLLLCFGGVAFGSFLMGCAVSKVGQEKAEKFKTLEEEVKKLKNELENSKSQNK